MAISGSRDDATNWLCGKLSNEQLLRENLGFIVLDCLRMLPSSKIRNEYSEITHYTNFLDHIIKGLFNNPDKHITQWPNTTLMKAKLENSKDTLNNSVFMKDILDSSVDKGADIKVLGFQWI
ncbi:14979_t:CDS:2, partial [Gigaspora rosea]